MSRLYRGRKDVDAGSPERAAHCETDAPDAMIERLLAEIVNKFYGGKEARHWMQDQKPLLLALTWPATWLNERGIGLPVADYEARLREIIKGIAEHGDLAAIKFFPSYFGDCVRKHFVNQGEKLYEERKHIRNAIDLAFLKGMPAQATAKGPDPMAVLASTHLVLLKARHARKTQKTDASQASLF